MLYFILYALVYEMHLGLSVVVTLLALGELGRYILTCYMVWLIILRRSLHSINVIDVNL